MQYYSLHVVLPFAYLSFCRLFPNFDRECERSDIRVLPSDFHFYIRGRPSPVPYHLGNKFTKTAFASRQGLETLLKRLLLTQTSFPNVRWISGTVTGVVSDLSDGTRLQSVLVHMQDGTIETRASLVVDCTGISRAGLKWLRRARYVQMPHTESMGDGQMITSYQPDVRSVSCIFRPSAEVCARLPIPGGYDNAGSFLALTANSESDSRWLHGVRLEGDRLLIAAGAWSPTERLPRTLQELTAFSHSLILDEPAPEWWFEMLDMLDAWEDTMECHAVRLPPSSYLRFHKASNLPSNFIVIGDSVMRFNPVLGRGMPSAVFGCITANKLLSQAATSGDADVSLLPTDFSKKFFEAQWVKIQPIWDAAKAFDYGCETTKPLPGESLSTRSWERFYAHHFMSLVSKDGEVGEVWWRITMLLGPSIDAFHPRVVLKVLWHALRQARRPRSSFPYIN